MTLTYKPNKMFRIKLWFHKKMCFFPMPKI